MKIIYNFLPKKFQDEIGLMMTANSFPWYYRPRESSGRPKLNDPMYHYTHDFVHTFYDDEQGPMSNYYTFLQPIKYFAEEKGYPNNGFHRLKANLNLQDPDFKEGQCFEPHVDMPSPHTVCIYYVNDSDGHTYIFDKMFDQSNPDQTKFGEYKTVKPIKGRAVFFNGLYYHAGSSPIKDQSRIIINADLVN